MFNKYRRIYFIVIFVIACIICVVIVKTHIKINQDKKDDLFSLINSNDDLVTMKIQLYSESKGLSELTTKNESNKLLKSLNKLNNLSFNVYDLPSDFNQNVDKYDLEILINRGEYKLCIKQNWIYYIHNSKKLSYEFEMLDGDLITVLNLLDNSFDWEL